MRRILADYARDRQRLEKGIEARIIGLLFLVYVVVFLNQHFTRFIVWFPFLALPLWLLSAKHSRISVFGFDRAISAARECWIPVSVLFLLLTISSLLSPWSRIALVELWSEMASLFCLCC